MSVCRIIDNALQVFCKTCFYFDECGKVNLAVDPYRSRRDTRYRMAVRDYICPALPPNWIKSDIPSRRRAIRILAYRERIGRRSLDLIFLWLCGPSSRLASSRSHCAMAMVISRFCGVWGLVLKVRRSSSFYWLKKGVQLSHICTEERNWQWEILKLSPPLYPMQENLEWDIPVHMKNMARSDAQPH